MQLAFNLALQSFQRRNKKDSAKKSNFYITIPYSLLYLLISPLVPFQSLTVPPNQLVKEFHPRCRCCYENELTSNSNSAMKTVVRIIGKALSRKKPGEMNLDHCFKPYNARSRSRDMTTTVVEIGGSNTTHRLRMKLG